MVPPNSKQTSSHLSTPSGSKAYRTNKEQNKYSKDFDSNYFGEDELDDSYDDYSYDTYNGYDTE